MEIGWSMQYFYSLHGHNRVKDIWNPAQNLVDHSSILYWES